MQVGSMTVPTPTYETNKDALLNQIKNLPPQFRERALNDVKKLYDEEFIKKFKDENAELFIVPPPVPIVVPKPQILLEKKEEPKEPEKKVEPEK